MYLSVPLYKDRIFITFNNFSYEKTTNIYRVIMLVNQNDL